MVKLSCFFARVRNCYKNDAIERTKVDSWHLLRPSPHFDFAHDDPLLTLGVIDVQNPNTVAIVKFTGIYFRHHSFLGRKKHIVVTLVTGKC